MNPKLDPICPNCYWFTGRYCEIYGNRPQHRNCINYLNDFYHYRRVRKWLENEPEKALANWNLLDDIDRKKFYNKWGKFLNKEGELK